MAVIKHGHARSGNYWEKRRKFSREYTSWLAMRQRCLDPNNPKFGRYGGRGIKICDVWLASFSTFFADLGCCPAGHTLGRKDNDGPYSADNCRWENIFEDYNLDTR